MLTVGILAPNLFGAVFHVHPTESAASVALCFGLREALVLVILAWAVRRYLGLTLRDLGVVRPSFADVGLGVVIGVALIAVSIVVTAAIPDHGSSWLVQALSHGGAADQAAAVAVVGIWSPFVQEAVFRGALLRALRERLPVSGSVGVSALVFGAVHTALGWTTVVNALVVGLVLGPLTVRRRNLTAAITAHAVINTLVCANIIAWRHLVHRPH